MNGVHIAVGSGQCKLQHRAGSSSIVVSQSGHVAVEHIEKLLPSLQHIKLWQSHCPARALDCFPESLEARIGGEHPSCDRSCLVLVAVPSPIARVLFPHHIPYTHV